MMDILQIGKILGGKISQNSPTLLTGLGVAGLIVTASFAARNMLEADRVIKDFEASAMAVTGAPEYETDFKTKVKLAWKCFIPTLAIGAVSAVCIIGANRISTQRAAALGAAFAATESTLRLYGDKVREVVGERKAEEIRQEVAASKIEHVPGSNTVVMTGKGETLVFDTFTGRYFKGDVEMIRRAENTINFRLVNGTFVSLNEFYGEIDVPGIKIGDDIGWIPERLMEISFGAKLDESGVPCVVMDFLVGPKHDLYQRY